MDGVRLGCLSPGQLEPHWGKKGELKRWKQFLIRGDPKRGKRSFQRAQRRADKRGQTVYKGKIMCSRSGVDLSWQGSHLQELRGRLRAARFYVGMREDCVGKLKLSLSTTFKQALALTFSWCKKPTGEALVRGRTRAGRTSTLQQRSLGRRVFWWEFGPARLTHLRLPGGRSSLEGYSGSEPAFVASNGTCSTCIRSLRQGEMGRLRSTA